MPSEEGKETAFHPLLMLLEDFSYNSYDRIEDSSVEPAPPGTLDSS